MDIINELRPGDRLVLLPNSHFADCERIFTEIKNDQVCYIKMFKDKKAYPDKIEFDWFIKNLTIDYSYRKKIQFDEQLAKI